MSPAWAAARNAVSTRSVSALDARGRSWTAATRARAREASLRLAAGVLPSTSAISPNGRSKTSCSTSATRSAGPRDSITTSIAVLTDSSTSTWAAASGPVVNGSGSQGPT
ncbi:hypothetical protein BJF90_45160 [Pseudonocardia sp. CNS-004]|nr:hypothetical protein BJF90_45160 [Pseudonocardia sp. CNS-004]